MGAAGRFAFDVEEPEASMSCAAVGVVAVPRVYWDRGTDGCRFAVGGRCDLWL